MKNTMTNSIGVRVCVLQTLLVLALAAGNAQDLTTLTKRAAVAARVGETEIPTSTLRTRARMLASSPLADNDTDLQSLHRRALRQIIRETVLLKAADDEGLSVSDGDLSRGIFEMQAAAAQSDDPSVRTAFDQAAGRLGVALDQFSSEPRVLAAYRRLWKLGAIRARIVERLPFEDRKDPAKLDNAIERFVSEWKEQITILPAGRQLTGELQ
jgi:hypothetical protein